MKTLSELFIDYINLGRSIKNKIYNPEYKDLGEDRDIILLNNTDDEKEIHPTLIRKVDGEYRIHFLYNGSKIIFPKEFYILIKGFLKYNENEVFYRGDNMENPSYMDSVIYFLCKIFTGFETTIPTVFEEIIGIFKIGTKGFRELLLSKFDIFIPPIECYSIDENYEV